MRGAAMSFRAGLSGLVFLLLAAAGVMEENTWEVNYPAPHICALKGSSVDIPCTFTYPTTTNQERTVIEQRFWFTKSDSNGPLDLRSDPDFSDRVEYLFKGNDCTLRITNLRDSDAGLYKFRFIANHQKISFTSEPGVTLSITDLQVQVERVSTMADLRCHSSCALAEYVWFRDGQKMEEYPSYPSSSSYSTISVHVNSRYSCAVKGREDLRSPEVWIAGWAVTLSSTQICAVRGSTVDIPCTFSYPTMINGITTKVKDGWWFKQGYSTPEDLKSDSGYRGRVEYLLSAYDCTLRITDLRESDSAEYKFRFTTNQRETPVTSSPGVSLSVTDLQVEAKRSGSNVVLTCRSSCNSVSYFWNRNKMKLNEEGSSLTVYFNDNNKYSCGVRGLENYPSPEVYAPKPPTVLVSPSAEVLEGTSVTLTCSSDANPAPTYTWYKRTGDQRSPPVRTNQKLYFGSIKASDSGEYYCTAVNKHGEKQSEVKKLDVQYGPKPPVVSASPSAEVKEGTPVNLSCTVDANPPANYTWYKKNDDKPKSFDPIFTIMDTRPEHSGTYVCVTQSERGRQNSTVLLTVVSGSLTLIVNIIRVTVVIFMFTLLIPLYMWKRKKKTVNSSDEPNKPAVMMELDQLDPDYESI